MNNHIQVVLKSSTTEMSLNDQESGIYLVPELDGLTGLPEIRTTSGVNAGYDGGWTSAQNFDARSITLRGVIANSDVATVERMRKQLISLLAEGKNEELTFDFVTEAGNAYELKVRTIACEMAMQSVLTQQEFLIQLRADDPLIYDNSAGSESVIVQVQKALGGFQINFELPLSITGGEGDSTIENNGLEKAYPTVTMYGALHNPIIINQTTNQQMQINADLAYAEGGPISPEETAVGNPLTITDAVDAPLNDYSLYGNTVQNGTPTPSAPVAVQTTTGENTLTISDGTSTQSYEVNLDIGGGKNLLKYSWPYTTGYYDGSGNWSTDARFACYDKYFEVEPNTTYSFSSSHSNTNMAILWFDENKNWVSRTATTSATSASGTSPATAKYARLQVRYETNTAISYVLLSSMSLQFEQGSVSSYEPFVCYELCKIGTYQDYIWKDGDTWKVHKAINKVVLNGSEDWQFYTGNILYIDSITDYRQVLQLICCCDYYDAVQNPQITSQMTTDKGIAFRGEGSKLLYIKDSAYSDAATFKTWLNSHPASVYYQLATPTDTAITNTALIEQLDAILANAKTYAGTTNISLVATAGNASGELQVEYFTDTTAPVRDVLVIDSRLRTITLNGLDVYNLKTEGSEFLTLAPGENKLMLRSDNHDDNGYAEVNYKQGYLTI